jgi:hypothetical protein
VWSVGGMLLPKESRSPRSKASVPVSLCSSQILRAVTTIHSTQTKLSKLRVYDLRNWEFFVIQIDRERNTYTFS